jgi:hypothetical protein
MVIARVDDIIEIHQFWAFIEQCSDLSRTHMSERENIHMQGLFLCSLKNLFENCIKSMLVISHWKVIECLENAKKLYNVHISIIIQILHKITDYKVNCRWDFLIAHCVELQLCDVLSLS